MLLTFDIAINGFHKPTGNWFTVRTKRGVRAVSLNHGYSKALKAAADMPVFADRANSPDWRDVSAKVVNLVSEAR